MSSYLLPFSAVEKHRQYHDHEETAEMIAARIDRDVVSEKLQVILLNVCEILQLYFVGRLFPHGKLVLEESFPGSLCLCGRP